MHTPRFLVALACGVTLSSFATAQRVAFAAPVMLRAGEKVCGKGRLYPSPVFHDVNGDGTLDLVIGDLFGRVTFAPGVAKKPGAFGPEEPLLDRDGDQLKFHNW